MRYHGHKICPHKQTNEQTDEHGRWTAGKHNASADTVGCKGIKNNLFVVIGFETYQNIHY